MGAIWQITCVAFDALRASIKIIRHKKSKNNHDILKTTTHELRSHSTQPSVAVLQHRHMHIDKLQVTQFIRANCRSNRQKPTNCAQYNLSKLARAFLEWTYVLMRCPRLVHKQFSALYSPLVHSDKKISENAALFIEPLAGQCATLLKVSAFHAGRQKPNFWGARLLESISCLILLLLRSNGFTCKSSAEVSVAFWSQMLAIVMNWSATHTHTFHLPLPHVPNLCTCSLAVTWCIIGASALCK